MGVHVKNVGLSIDMFYKLDELLAHTWKDRKKWNKNCMISLLERELLTIETMISRKM